MRCKPFSLGAVAGVFAVYGAWMLSEVRAQPMISPPSAATSISSQPEEVNSAMARFQTHDFAGALKLLREAAKKDPNVPPPHVMMARMLLQSNILQLARNELEQSVLEDPDEPDAYVDMAELAMRERRITEGGLLYQKAESLLAKFDKSDKRKAELQAAVYRGLASVAEAREDWAGAKQQLEAWLNLEPTNAIPMQRLAGCLVQQKKIPEALQALKNAADADPDGVQRGIQRKTLVPEAILAQLCQQAGDQEDAQKYWIEALTTAPRDIATRLAAARWEFETEHLDQALRQVDVAMKLDEKSRDAKLLRGLIAAFQKDYTTAERYFEQIALQTPDDMAATNNFAMALSSRRTSRRKRGR